MVGVDNSTSTASTSTSLLNQHTQTCTNCIIPLHVPSHALRWSSADPHTTHRPSFGNGAQ